MSWQYYPYLSQELSLSQSQTHVPAPSLSLPPAAPADGEQTQDLDGVDQQQVPPAPPAHPYATQEGGHHSPPTHPQEYPNHPHPHPSLAHPHPHFYRSFSYHHAYPHQPLPPLALPDMGPQWDPAQTPDTATSSTGASSSDSQMLSDDHSAKPPMLSRSRRAAASKARSTISSIATSLRSPPLSSVSVNSSHPSHSHSRTSSTLAPDSPEYDPGPIKTPRSAVYIPSAPHIPKQDGTLATVDTETGAIQVELKNSRGALLPAPPGSQLEVNDLLILHPPTLSPSQAPARPMNQYNHAPAPEGYRSMYEMYTCRVCAKTYDGKNARSVARRHLQDKHGVPLALQKRRTRWDAEPDRPKTAAALREKTLKIKRDWAQKSRNLHKLEREHAAFLERFGPEGVYAPCGTRIIAPSMRDSSSRVKSKDWPNGWLEWRELPKSLREGLAAISGAELPEIPEDEEPVDDGQPIDASDCDLSYEEYRLHHSSTACDPTTQAVTAPTATPPSFSSSRLGPNTTPPSDPTRAAGNQWGSWAPATHVDDRALEIAIAQHYQAFQITDGEYQEQPMQTGPSAPGSPGTVYAYEKQQDDLWVQDDVSSRLWYAEVADQEAREVQDVHEAENDKPEKDTEVEAVAAESLLNLHSTPARPGDHTDQQDENDTEVEKEETVGLLEAPVITSRSRPQRTRSVIQPFAKSRPEAATRSLSTGEIGALDDPFAMSPSAGLPKRRRSTIASPSPLTSKRKRDKDESPRVPMSVLRANTLGGNCTQGGYTTPVRPKGDMAPSSLAKGWVLSSPGNADAAASLGLVPQWAAGNQTPGLSGLVGSETPGAGARWRE